MNRSQRVTAILFMTAAIPFVLARYSFAETRMAQATAQPDASPVPSAPRDAAKADYEAAERIDSLGGWDVFLAQHPTGDYTAQAQEQRAKAAARLAALPGSATPSNDKPSDKSGGTSQHAPAARSGRSYLGTIECAAKFQAAKLTGKLNGRKWDDFRTAECGPQAVRASVEAAPASGPAAPPPPAADAVFPSAIDPKYANEFSDKGRVKTCADQFNLNKAVNANGGMRWIDKGGGYYAECNRRLNGA